MVWTIEHTFSEPREMRPGTFDEQTVAAASEMLAEAIEAWLETV